ncbi:MAG: hypothetical protein KBT68_12225, partial [bacterium]|nr:hypothetical protein [Candidatus Colisoma equi]
KTEAWTAYSENPSKWTGVQVTSKGMDKLLCITNDGIRYIALGILYSDVDFRVVLSSTDGSTWTKLGVSEVSDVESRVCFGSISSGVYAGVYGFNKYSLSDDAVAWNLNGIAGLPSGKFPYLNGICFGDGRLVAVGNVIAVSESGRADLSYLGEVDQSVLNDVCHKGV